jgi:hypothetical protein
MIEEIRSINLQSSNIVNFIPKFFSIQSLTAICLDFTPIGDKGMEALSGAVIGVPCLKSLSLQYCKLTDFSSKFLRNILLSIHGSMETLNVSGNLLGEAGFSEICKNKNNSLIKLNYSNNNMIKIPNDCSSSIPSFVSIDLSGNPLPLSEISALSATLATFSGDKRLKELILPETLTDGMAGELLKILNPEKPNKKANVKKSVN